MKTTIFAGLAIFASLSAQAKPLKVYILAGQSNMQGHAKLSTIEHIALDPATKPMFDAMHDANGRLKVCEKVWISSIGCGANEKEIQSGQLTAGFGASKDKIGPEFTFGITMSQQSDEPILLIKTSWGGKSLNTDFRPPSAGAYPFSPQQLAKFKAQGKNIDDATEEKQQATGVYYRMMIEHIKQVLANPAVVVPSYKASDGIQLAGFAWFQGWNDIVDSGTYPNRDKKGGYDAYSTVMAHFIRDVRRDLAAPELPFVIGVLGVGGPTKNYTGGEKRYQGMHQNFRDAMAAPASLPEFKKNVVAVLIEKYWDAELKAAIEKDQLIKDSVNQTAKEKKFTPAETRVALDSAREKGLTAREKLILEKAISNQQYHYLGCAKILGGIGKGLAQALTDLSKK